MARELRLDSFNYVSEMRKKYYNGLYATLVKKWLILGENNYEKFCVFLKTLKEKEYEH